MSDRRQPRLRPSKPVQHTPTMKVLPGSDDYFLHTGGFNLIIWILDGIKDPVKVTTKNHKDSGDEGKENVIINEPASSSLPVIEQEPLPALIKALPEPTRVKSPEQLVVRSPDPVNWTVPLDTGKTFTVTQNIRGGEIITSRPHSELKVSMTVRPPPQAPAAVAAAVHSPMIPIVSSSAAAVTKPSEQQQDEPQLNSGPAPGTPPHDSLGYFSEPEIIVECCSSPI